MITLFKGKYSDIDYRYLLDVIREGMGRTVYCDSTCETCENTRPCNDLKRLCKYIKKELEEENNDNNQR